MPGHSTAPALCYNNFMPLFEYTCNHCRKRYTVLVGMTAASYLTLDDLAPNRIICGIGAWWDPLAANVGIQRTKPLLAMRETVTVVRDLLAMKNVTFHGEFVNVTGIELDFFILMS